VTLASAPLWIQVLLGAEAATLAWLVARFGWRGLGLGLAGALAFWFALGLGASFLVGRLEGGSASTSDMLPGAVQATWRIAWISLPLIAAAALVGAALRRGLRRRKPRAG
jgi:hypothetical protein